MTRPEAARDFHTSCRTGWILLFFIAVSNVPPASDIGATTTPAKVDSNAHAKTCIMYCSNWHTVLSGRQPQVFGGGTPCVLQLDVLQMWEPHSPEPLAGGVARGSHRMTGRRAGQ